MGREDDDSHSNLFGRLVKSDSESDSSKRSGFGFNGSFSASASTSASTGDSSRRQPDQDSAPTTKYTMFGPFEIEFGWPNERSMASMALSSYSPLALRDMPQPRPSDAPSNLDASIFTFEDAFEDLLAVSQGQPLPDITTRYEQRKLLRSMFPTGEPAWFWMRRLRSQGLLEDSGPSQWMKSANHNWEQFHRELDRRAANVWRAAMGEEEDRQDRIDDSSRREQKDEDEGFHGHNPLLEDSEQHRQRRREPDNFDEFFDSVQSSFSDAQSTWDSFVKSVTEGHPSSFDKRQQSDKPAEDEKRVVTKNEYVDRFGYLHSKTTVKTLDEEGNEIGSETHYTVRPAEKDEKKAESSEQAKDEGSGIKAEGRLETKTGWFWK